MKIDINGKVKTQGWWNTNEELQSPPPSYEDSLEIFDKLFTDACRIRMRSDVPITSALSGGIDSSAVFSRVWKLGSEQHLDRLRERWSSAFTASFPGTLYDETEQARLLYHEFHYRYMPTILKNFDRATMLSGIESRMPFMDYRILNFMFSLPSKYKMGLGYTKRILRDIIRKDLPKEITNRTWKVGFNHPMTEWFDGPLRKWLADTVSEKAFIESPNWNGKEIQKYTLNKHTKNSFWHIHECMTIWPVLSAHLILKS
jgi:asparagine synthetase B (glutamine-hydrolysing)